MLKPRIKKEIEEEVSDYMTVINEYLAKVNNGTIPPEYRCSIKMLECYYKQFLILTAEIDNNLDEYVVKTKFGMKPNPIFNARDGVVSRLDALLKSLGCSFNSQIRLKLIDRKPVEELSPLEEFAQNEMAEYR